MIWWDIMILFSSLPFKINKLRTPQNVQKWPWTRHIIGFWLRIKSFAALMTADQIVPVTIPFFRRFFLKSGKNRISSSVGLLVPTPLTFITVMPPWNTIRRKHNPWKMKYILFQKEVFCSEFVIVLKLNQLVFLQYIGAGCGARMCRGPTF